MKAGDVCLVDSATMHTICSLADLIEGSGKAKILLASGTKLTIQNA